MALSFASNVALKCFIYISLRLKMKLYHLASCNNHDNNVCWTGLGGLICNAITYIKLLHSNCYHGKICSTYYIPCQKHNNNNLCFLRAWVATQNNHCFNVANEWKRVHIHIHLAPYLLCFGHFICRKRMSAIYPLILKKRNNEMIQLAIRLHTKNSTIVSNNLKRMLQWKIKWSSNSYGGFICEAIP